MHARASRTHPPTRTHACTCTRAHTHHTYTNITHDTLTPIRTARRRCFWGTTTRSTAWHSRTSGGACLLLGWSARARARWRRDVATRAPAAPRPRAGPQPAALQGRRATPRPRNHPPVSSLPSPRSRNRELGELFDSGMGLHHAGMLRSDRNLTERMFSDGIIKVGLWEETPLV